MPVNTVIYCGNFVLDGQIAAINISTKFLTNYQSFTRGRVFAGKFIKFRNLAPNHSWILTISAIGKAVE